MPEGTCDDDDDDVKSVLTGWHKAHVVFEDPTSCPDPHFGVRLAGSKAALVPVLLTQATSSPAQWTGSFHLPLNGTYRVETQWYGCRLDETLHEDSEQEEKALSNDDPAIEFVVVGPTTFPSKSFVRALEHEPPSIGEGAAFSNSVWMSTRDMVFDGGPDVTQYTDYLWVDPNRPDRSSSDLLILDQPAHGLHTAISRNGTLTEEHNTYKFNHVGNYELVCFFGGPSAQRLRNRFMALLRSVFRGVRPFKFHFYNVTNLIHPDYDGKGRCRKCKHIILSVDELDNGPLSQADFLQQFETFVKHLQKLMDDPTFPIWLLTNSEPVSATTHCHAPYVVPRTTDHPCNDVMRDLMRRQVFQSRVNFMDNADLTLPFFDDRTLKHRDQIVANMALRLFVLIGKGVQDWRDRGQQGKSNGLHRNGTVEPNFELVAYDWNQPV